jgi:hypothetical protein
MLAMLNDPKLKQSIHDQLMAHYKADEIIKGQYWENGKGCAIGCILHGSNHFDFEDRFGIPVAIAKLVDRIFEGLPNGEAKEFPLQFWDVIPDGADLSGVTDKFLYWLLGGDQEGEFITSDPKALKAISTVRELFRRNIAGEVVTMQEWKYARAAAYAAYAANAAAYAAAYAAYAANVAAYAATDAADAADAAYAAIAAINAATYAANAATNAAADATYAANAANARNKAWQNCRDKLLQLLADAPVPA